MKKNCPLSIKSDLSTILLSCI